VGQPTETTLKDWRYGQTQAECLCAGILNVEGYQSIDPQCPLGGPDGLKDIVCYKDGNKFISAAFFPTSENSFGKIKTKFKDDFEGVKKNGAQGFIFIVNQKLSPSERDELKIIATDKEAVCEIYHLQRIQGILDSPKGYGLRIEYLRITMSTEEQYGFWAVWSNDFRDFFRKQQESMDSLSSRIDNMLITQSVMLRAISHKISSITDEKYLEILKSIDFGPQVSSYLNLSILLSIHSALCFNVDSTVYSFSGKFRDSKVWIGLPGSDMEHATYIPPEPENVPALTNNLLNTWNEKYNDLFRGNNEDKICDIAIFYHKFLSIHPFLDGNGRVALFLLNQQAKDLLGINKIIKIDKDFKCYHSLQKADAGDLDPLKKIIFDAIYC